MTATAGSLKRRERARGQAAAKARREKIILAVGGVLLLGLFAFQGPKVLKEIRGSSPTTPATVAAPATSPAPSGPAAARHVNALARIDRFPAKDPFVAQLDPLGKQTDPPLATAPPVRTSHFVSKDPFVPQVSSTVSQPPADKGSNPPATPASPAATPAAGGTTGYIVMLASVDKSDGRRQADQAAAAARRAGVTGVKIVDSTSYGTLRSGFYAVFSGPYKTLAELRSELAAARARGYISAYTRRLGR